MNGEVHTTECLMLYMTRKRHVRLHSSCPGTATVCSSDSRYLRWQLVLSWTSICASKSLIGALEAAKGNSGHEGKSIGISSSVYPGLMALLMLLCCLPFVTKGQPSPIKTLKGNTWLAVTVCRRCTGATWTEISLSYSCILASVSLIISVLLLSYALRRK